MIDKVNTSRIFELPRSSDGNQQQNAQYSQKTSQDASLQADYEELIKKAASIVQNDDIDIQKIKKLFDTGQLDSQQNIRRTAQNIIDMGI